MLNVQLRPRPAYALWVDRRRVAADPAQEGSSFLFDLRREFVVRLNHAVDLLLLYVPRAALDAVAEDEGAQRIQTLAIAPGKAVEDPVIRHLASSLLPALQRPEQANELFVEHVFLALHSHLASCYGGLVPKGRLVRGGLTPRQERIAKELLSARLEGGVSLQELADACELSRSHFARAFKHTTGQSPHRWLSSRRIDLAQHLLSNSALSIAEIASRLGFADQSHFARNFLRAIGSSPGIWRRSRRG
jgi:AraC-like DNA-binding protein